MSVPSTCALGHELPEGRLLCPTCGMGALPKRSEPDASPVATSLSVTTQQAPGPVAPALQPQPVPAPKPKRDRRVPVRGLAATLVGVLALGGVAFFVLGGDNGTPAAVGPQSLTAAADGAESGPVVYEQRVLPGGERTSTPRGRVGALCKDLLVAARDRDAADVDGNRVANFGGSFRLEVAARGLVSSGVTEFDTNFAYDLAETADKVADRMYDLGEWDVLELSAYGNEPSFEQVRNEECATLVVNRQARAAREQRQP